MTLAATTRRNDYTGNGSVDTYAYGFKVFDDDDLLVVIADTAGAETTLTKTTDYTVTGVGDASGGNIVLVNSSQAWLDADGDLKTNYHLTVIGNRSFIQDTRIRDNGSFYPNVIEDEWDKELVLLQQLKEKINRCITFQTTSTDSGAQIEESMDGNTGKLLEVNDDEDGFVFSSITADQIVAYAAAAAADAAAAAASASSASGFSASASASASSITVSAAAATASAAAAAASAVAAAASAATATAASGLIIENSHASPYAVVAGTSIPFVAGTIRIKKYIQGSAGPVTSTAVPVIQNGTTEGQELYLVGCSDVNTVTINTADGVDTHGDITLGDNEFALFNWDSGQALWVLVARSV